MKSYKKVLSIALFVGVIFSSCTTTKHILKRTEKIKVYKTSEVIKSYGLDKTRDRDNIPISPVIFDANYLMGFAFTEELKERIDSKYSSKPVPILDDESPLDTKTIFVNIDLCKHWKHTSFRETPLQETAYGKNHFSLNPTQYKLFMSLERLKKKNLIPSNPNEQEDICIYIDSEFSGHLGRFKDKSNKIRYKASEINKARVALEKMSEK